MLQQVLAHPRIYQLIQSLLYKKGKRAKYVSTHLRPTTGSRILDLGCGPGSILEHLGEVEYTGFDTNESCIERARNRYGDRGTFICGEAPTTGDMRYQGRYDLVMANAVLHHLDDSSAIHLISSAYSSLKSGGRFVTLDGYFKDGQSAIARLLLSKDRGKFVRTREAYEALVTHSFASPKITVYDDFLTIPYDLIVIEGLKT